MECVFVHSTEQALTPVLMAGGALVVMCLLFELRLLGRHFVSVAVGAQSRWLLA